MHNRHQPLIKIPLLDGSVMRQESGKAEQNKWLVFMNFFVKLNH